MCDYKQLGAEYQNDRLGLSSDIMPTLIGWKSMPHVSIKHATLLPFKNKVCLIINVEKQCVLHQGLNKEASVNCALLCCKALQKQLEHSTMVRNT